MALTLSNKEDTVFGNKLITFLDLAFPSSYAFGGETLDYRIDPGMTRVDMVHIPPVKGYTLEYDYTNRKVKVFAPALPIIYEEKHTAVAYTVTLDHPAAWIMNVCKTGQNMAWGKIQAYGSLAANTFCLTAAIADGVRTQLTTPGETDAIIVTYVTQAWAELYACLVQEEAVTLATGANDLANKMMAFGFCEAATTGILLPEDIADTTASGSVGIKMGYATGALDAHADENTQAAVVTYLAEPASGWLHDRFIEDEDPTKAGADPYTQAFDFPLLVWCITGALTVTGGATQVIVDIATTAAAGEATINWGKGPGDLLATAGVPPTEGFVFGLKSNLTVTAGAYIKGYPWEIPGLVPLEVKNATDLSGLTGLKAMLIGN